jgi:hypothetical protein
MYSTPVGRAIVWLKRLAGHAARIADALERAHPPTPTLARRPAEFSVATPEDFERGFDDRGRDEGASR